jgi:hypothetical protein
MHNISSPKTTPANTPQSTPTVSRYSSSTDEEQSNAPSVVPSSASSGAQSTDTGSILPSNAIQDAAIGDTPAGSNLDQTVNEFETVQQEQHSLSGNSEVGENDLTNVFETADSTFASRSRVDGDDVLDRFLMAVQCASGAIVLLLILRRLFVHTSYLDFLFSDEL